MFCPFFSIIRITGSQKYHALDRGYERVKLMETSIHLLQKRLHCLEEELHECVKNHDKIKAKRLLFQKYIAQIKQHRYQRQLLELKNQLELYKLEDHENNNNNNVNDNGNHNYWLQKTIQKRKTNKFFCDDDYEQKKENDNNNVHHYVNEEEYVEQNLKRLFCVLQNEESPETIRDLI